LINSGLAGWQTITERDLALEVNSAIRVLHFASQSTIDKARATRSIRPTLPTSRQPSR
jgi:hypothetical protein